MKYNSYDIDKFISKIYVTQASIIMEKRIRSNTNESDFEKEIFVEANVEKRRIITIL